MTDRPHEDAPDSETIDPEPSGPEASHTDSEERPWWDNPAFPWRGKPSKADIGCLLAISGMGIYGLVMLPLRPVILTWNAYVSAAINGGSVSMAVIGGEVATGVHPPWMMFLGLLIGTISVIKFDWIFWWAGRLWGDRLIDYLLQGRGKRAKRNAVRAQKVAHKYETVAMALPYIPLVPIPSAIIYGALGISGTSLRKFLFLDILFAVITRGIYLYLGYHFGEPVVELLEQFAKYSLYLSLALVAGIFIMMFWRNSRKAKASAEE